LKEIGQLIIMGVSGLSLTDEEKKYIEENKVGGIILFAHNFENVAQLAELVNSIQQLRDEYPLFISVDQEGGRVRRFKKDFIQLPAMLEIAKNGSPKFIYEIHELVAKELHIAGVNLSYAPVCDIFTNPNNTVIGDRAFGTTAEEVEKFVSAAIRGLQTHGVIACAKHFPGHGDSTKDSHYDLPIIKNDIETLRNREWKPFNKAIKSRVETMMMAHLIVDAIDPELPTSLSEKAYSILREELRFKKIIMTDDMEMGAIVDKYQIENASFMALNAGADVLIYRSFDQGRNCLEYLKEKYKTKELKSKKIDEKLERVFQCKKEYLSNYEPIDPTRIAEQIQGLSGNKIVHELVAAKGQ
jgi:beta-N-acetylhexosaminidase